MSFYSNWNAAHHALSTERWIELVTFIEELTSYYNRNQFDAHTIENITKYIRNAGITDIFNKDKRFPRTADAGYLIYVRLHDKVVRGQAAKTCDELELVRVQILEGTHDNLGKIKNALRSLIEIFHSDTFPGCYDQSRLEVDFKLVWAMQYWNLKNLKEEKQEFLSHCQTAVNNGNFPGVTGLINWEEPPDAFDHVSLQQQEVAQGPTEVTAFDGQTGDPMILRVEHTPSKWSVISSVLLAILSAIMTFFIGFYLKKVMKKRNVRFRKKGNFPWCQWHDGGDDDDDGNGGHGPRSHAGLQYASESRDFGSIFDELESDAGTDELIAQAGNQLGEALVALQNGDLVVILGQVAVWTNALRVLTTYQGDGANKYQQLAAYLALIRDVNSTFEEDGTVSGLHIQELELQERALISMGFALGDPHLSEQITARQNRSVALAIVKKIHACAHMVGQEMLEFAQSEMCRFALDRSHDILTPHEQRAINLFMALGTALQRIGATAGETDALSAICEAETILSTLSQELNINLRNTYLEASRRFEITRTTTESNRRIFASTSGENANDEEVRRVTTATIEKIEAETSSFREIAATQQAIARATREGNLREHILQPINTAANLGMAGGMLMYGRGRSILPLGGAHNAAQIPGVPTRNFRPFAGRGNRLGGSSSTLRRR